MAFAVYLIQIKLDLLWRLRRARPNPESIRAMCRRGTHRRAWCSGARTASGGAVVSAGSAPPPARWPIQSVYGVV